MISLEQVRQLDIRVKKAVAAVKALSTENSVLKQQVQDLEARLDELSKEATTRIADEEQLEVSLQSVLDTLDEVDSETSGIEPEPPADNSIIETAAEPETDEEEVFFSPEETEAEVKDEEIQNTEPPAGDETDSETTVTDVPAESDPVSKEAVSGDAALSEDPPETINLDSEKEDEGFQSEFDIF